MTGYPAVKVRSQVTQTAEARTQTATKVEIQTHNCARDAREENRGSLDAHSRAMTSPPPGG